MTKSCANQQGSGRDPGRGAALALQGGGAHGAFTWGVLDQLLEQGLEVRAICGVSSGALIGVMLVQGMVRGGRDGARSAMRTLWQRFARAHAMSPLQSAPLERWLWGWDLSNSMVWRGLEATMRLFSPAEVNSALWPFAHHPLRALIADLVEPDLLTDPAAPRLFVSATDVETGEAVLFDNAAITVDVLLASSCLPFVFPAVEIDGRAYWDGGYSGNPPLRPLLAELAGRGMTEGAMAHRTMTQGKKTQGKMSRGKTNQRETSVPPGDLLLIRAQPARRPGVPRTPLEITNRLNEIACHNVLQAELDALPDDVTLTTYEADDALLDLPISSKFNGEEEFLALLFKAGRAAAAMQGLPHGLARQGLAAQGLPPQSRLPAAVTAGLPSRATTRPRPPHAPAAVRIAPP